MIAPFNLVLPGADYVLGDAHVPAAFLADPPSEARRDSEGCFVLDIVVENGRIAALRPAGSVVAGPPRLSLGMRQVWPTLIDLHTHLDKGQVLPRVTADGTLSGGAHQTAADRALWSPQDMAGRMGFGLRCAYAHGVSAIRTHLDSPPEQAAQSFAVFRNLRDEWAGRVELQGVGLAPLSAFRSDWGRTLADLVADSGGVMGGVTDGLGFYAGTALEELDSLLDAFLMAAAERDLDVDLHVDQTDATDFFALPRIAAAVLRTGFKRRVLCGHCVSLALVSDEEARDAIQLSRDAGLDFITLPAPMMYLQDRVSGRTPRWRGVTLVQELAAANLRVAVGGDNCRDAWYPFGDHDMLETLQFAIRVLQIDAPLSAALGMAGPAPSDIGRLGHHGRIAVGAPADLIILKARTINEAMCRPQADRRVVRNGPPSRGRPARL